MPVDRRQFLARAGSGALAFALAGRAEAQTSGGPTVGPEALSTLRSAVRGPVLLPGTADFDRARQLPNARFAARRPTAIVQPLDTLDTQAVVRWAQAREISLSIRSGGHSFAGYSMPDDAVVVDTRRLDGIELSGNLVTIGAGVQLGDVYRFLADRGATIPGGSYPSLGISGLTLGGGFGLAARALGLTCDRLRAATVVTADGRIRRIDERQDEDLFWASRGGGGGNFAIAADLTFEVHPVTEAVGFIARFPWSVAGEAMGAWQRLMIDAPGELGSILVADAFGEHEPTLAAHGQFFGDEEAARELLRPLTGFEQSSLSTAVVPYGDLVLGSSALLEHGIRSMRPGRSRFHVPEGIETEFAPVSFPPQRFVGSSDYVAGEIGAAAASTLVRAVERRFAEPSYDSAAIVLEAYGGAIGRVSSESTAFVHRDQSFCIQQLAAFPADAGEPAARSWLSSLRTELRPHVSGFAYQNYVDPTRSDWQHAYYGSNYERLREVKTKYDPARMFRFPQMVEPTGSD